MSDVKRYDPFGYDGLSALMHEDELGGWVLTENYEALEVERDTLRAEVERLRGLLKECRPAVAGEVAKWQRLAVMGGHRGGELASGLLQRIDAALEVSA